MKKKYLAVIIGIFLLNVSCGTINNAVNSITNKSSAQAKSPSGDIPSNVKNAKPDAHAAEETSIILSVYSDDLSSVNGGVFFGKEQFRVEAVAEKVNQLLQKTPAEKQLIYLNAGNRVSNKTIALIFDILRKQNIENVALVVFPQVKTGAAFHILKVKTLPEPKDEVNPTEMEEYSKRTFLTMNKDGKINFAKFDAKKGYQPDKEEIKPEELEAKINERFAGKTDKRIYLKAARSNNYTQVVQMIDASTGAGAEVYLVIDDLSE